jgi:hypothetical protein
MRFFGSGRQRQRERPYRIKITHLSRLAGMHHMDHRKGISRTSNTVL